MAFRSGMAHLVTRLQRIVDDTAESVWTTQELQDTLDEHKIRIWRELLEMEKTELSATDYEYRVFHSRHTNLEAGGSAYFNVEDATGTQRETADFTADYVRGIVTTTVNQAGTGLYLTGWSYDLDGAAADLWRERAGRVASYYDVRTDGHNLSRSQWHKHCLTQAERYAKRARPQTARMWTSGVFEHD